MALKERTYPREVFFAAFGVGPYECFFCREKTVTFEDVCVHHIDENRTHNHLYNLAPAHLGCHNRWHNALRKGVPRSAVVRAKCGVANRGRKLTPEHKAAINPAGRTHTPKTRAKMSASAKEYWANNPEARARASAARAAWWAKRGA